MNLNLIPERIHHGYRRRVRIRTWGLVFLAATVVLSIPIGWDWSREAKAARLRGRLAKLTASRTVMQAEWEQTKRELQQTQAQIERAGALRAKRAWSSLLALIVHEVPPNAWLVSIATEPALPPVQAGRPIATATTGSATDASSVTIDAPTRINIVGYAPQPQDPITLVSHLKGSGAFRSVVLERSALEPIEDGSYFRFDIACEW
jgi:hypothetical protein